ncbi:MAG: sigma 54-interacting transcriptional regulator [Planctomycetota bacterium]|nr:sigma 54-interacting transcriptional regulator [Planctomycetota bacterium]
MNPTLLQSISLDIAATRSVKVVLSGLVDGLAADPHVVLARIWLIQPGDQCSNCNQRNDCVMNVDCLHLVASAGSSQVDAKRNYGSLEGAFRRFPMGIRKIGKIAATGQAMNLSLQGDEAPWAAVPEWVKEEGIRSFAGQPLMFQGSVVGVLAIFSRQAIPEQDFHWLRTFADHAAVAIANARAFEEVAKLKEQLEQERDYLREEVRVDMNRSGFVGQSPALAQVLRQIDLVSPTEASVLVHGETGTGKEHVATMLHESSVRATGPMVRVNCASIPRELFESEFFGHKKGAFTGATQDRVGKFEIADGGTLFLDEVGEIPLELQGKLLRVLQEGTYSRIGEDRTRSVNVRIVAATNKDLKREAAEGQFREDLYYRLAVFPIEIPALRDRREDIPLLASFFLQRTTIRSNKTGLVLRNRDVKALTEYDWPGNVRELQNVIERAAILATADRLHFDLAPVNLPRPTKDRTFPTGPGSPGAIQTDAQIRELETSNLRLALEQTGWRVSGPAGAAALLGIKPTTLTSRMKAMGVSRPGSPG